MDNIKLPLFPLSHETLTKNYEFYKLDIPRRECSWDEIVYQLSVKYDIKKGQYHSTYFYPKLIIPKSIESLIIRSDTVVWTVINNVKSYTLYKRDPFYNLPRLQSQDFIHILYNPTFNEWYSMNSELMTMIEYFKGLPDDATLEQKIMYAVVLRTMNEYKAMDQNEINSKTIE